MKLIEYARENWMLTRWSGTLTETTQRFWLNQNRRTPAATVIESQGRYVIVVYSPDGKVLDVGAAKSRGDAMKIVARCLLDFVSYCQIPFTCCSEEFKDWLDM